MLYIRLLRDLNKHRVMIQVNALHTIAQGLFQGFDFFIQRGDVGLELVIRPIHNTFFEIIITSRILQEKPEYKHN